VEWSVLVEGAGGGNWCRIWQSEFVYESGDYSDNECGRGI
jgi:hypothetical protein